MTKKPRKLAKLTDRNLVTELMLAMEAIMMLAMLFLATLMLWH